MKFHSAMFIFFMDKHVSITYYGLEVDFGIDIEPIIGSYTLSMLVN